MIKRIITLTRNSRLIRKPERLQRDLFTKTEKTGTKKIIEVTLPGNTIGILIPVPDIQTFKLKYWNVVKGCQNVEFDFINTSIEDKFAFKRKKHTGSFNVNEHG